MAHDEVLGIWHLLGGLRCTGVERFGDLVPDWPACGVHRHSVPSLVIALAGCSRLELGRDRTITLPEGRLAIIDAWTRHAHHQPLADGATLVVGRIGRTADVEIWHRNRVWFGEVPLAAISRPLDGLLAMAPGAAAPADGLRLFTALAASTPAPQRVPAPVQRMSSFLWCLRNRPITAAQVLAASGLSYSVAHALFLQRFDETPKQYLLRTRLDLARRLLAAGSPLATVWAEAGFSSRADLTRRFRLAFGAPPRAWLAAGGAARAAPRRH